MLATLTAIAVAMTPILGVFAAMWYEHAPDRKAQREQDRQAALDRAIHLRDLRLLSAELDRLQSKAKRLRGA